MPHSKSVVKESKTESAAVKSNSAVGPAPNYDGSKRGEICITGGSHVKRLSSKGELRSRDTGDGTGNGLRWASQARAESVGGTPAHHL
jgi:hypothetical protein